MKDAILEAAIRISEQPGGWGRLTRESVATRAGVATGSVSKHYGTMVQFRRDIMRAAIRDSNLSIIAQGIASGDKHASKVSPELKSLALSSL
jgi:AcrR family transcriptional regulator